MPNDQITKETETLEAIAEILFASHANITRAHSSSEISGERMRLLMKFSYWNSIKPQPIEKQVIKKVYQPTPGEKESLQSLYQYIEKQIQMLCIGTTLSVLNSADARKKGGSKDKTLGILQENQNSDDYTDICNELPELLAKLVHGEETIGSDNWRQYVRSFYKLSTTDNLAWFSLLSIMSSLKLGYLHIANQQSISLYCKLFNGDHSSFNPAEKKSYQDIIVLGKLKCTIEGLASYLRKVTDLVKMNQNFHAAFAEGIMTAIPRKHSEQLAQTVQSFTKKSVLCVRLSSSQPGQIAAQYCWRSEALPLSVLYRTILSRS